MKVYIETLGCPKNFNDTEVAKGSLCGVSLTHVPTSMLR